MDFTAIAIVSCIFVFAPSIVFGFVLLNKRERNRMAALRCQKEILELEVEKERYKVRMLEEENRKYDKLIEHRELSGFIDAGKSHENR